MKDYQIQLDAMEAYLRRASRINMPFMVKGSLITRQYLKNPDMRYVADLDWVYLKFIEKEDDAGILFSKWVTKVTETHLNDGVKYRSFKENDFWRRIDYAMHDDFPTVDTDLLCWVNGELNDRISLDISYNLDIDYPPVELNYQPRVGDPFILKNTCPLPLQVSWKLHQLLSRPRVKDVFDVMHLVQNPMFTEKVLNQSLLALKKECERDKISVKKLNWYLNGGMEEYYKLKKKGWVKSKIRKFLNRGIPHFRHLDHLSISHYEYFTSQEYFKYKNLPELFQEFSVVLKQHGFSEDLIKSV